MVARLLVCALLAGSLTGCFVVDELDKSRALLRTKPPPKTVEEEPKAAPAKPASDYWEHARTFAPGGGGHDGENAVVSCQVRGQQQFMKRDDCLRRGGRPR